MTAAGLCSTQVSGFELRCYLVGFSGGTSLCMSDFVVNYTDLIYIFVHTTLEYIRLTIFDNITAKVLVSAG